MEKQKPSIRIDQVWVKVTAIVVALFFVYLADAMLSFWVQSFLDGIFNSGLMMGLVMGWALLLVLISSMFGALSLPMIDAVYSDLVARMGRERKHLIGLSSATTSMAYVIGPVAAGLIADTVGELETFFGSGDCQSVCGGSFAGGNAQEVKTATERSEELELRFGNYDL